MKGKVKKSSVEKKLVARLNGLKAISPILELHNGLSVVKGEALQTELKNAEQELSIMQTNMQVKRDEIKKLEKRITDYCSNTLTAVKSQFGADSIEYGKAGGTRTSLRQKPGRRSESKTKVRVKANA